MIVPIIVLSFILFAIAFIITEENAKYLLSGYNTMSDEERQKFDIKSYILFLKKFHIFLGISTFIISLLLLYLVNSDWSGLFLGTYPILSYIYFIWKGSHFLKEPSKQHKVLTYFGMLVLLVILVLICFEFKNFS